MTTAYSQLRSTFARLSRFNHLSAIAGWDMAAMMPPAGSKARSEALAELSVLSHQILTAKQVGEWLDQAESEDLNDLERADLREMRRKYQQSAVLPESLVQEKSLAGARCEHAWRIQRKSNDWDSFAENLREVVRLSREEAKLRSEATGVGLYDSLLDMYEPGMTSAKLDELFGDLKTWLPNLLKTVVEKQKSETRVAPVGPFDIEKQRQLGLQVMGRLGFNFDAGRLDVSAHPFCGGVPEDVRITTRYNEHEFLSAMMGVIHETGHARYEQNLPKEWLGQPVSNARSMGVHESQSLLFEMQLGCSEPFLKSIYPLVIEQFGQREGLDESNFIKLNQRVEAGLIRVDADEVSYPAHVILRYEIEKALIEGEIEVEDIPALWNRKMKEYLGIDTVGNYRDGCMQDIHWTDGGFGYFPTYTLGAMYAAQLFQCANHAIPTLQDDIARGDLTALFQWLQQNIWQHGSRFTTDQLIKNATGETLNPAYFRKHLESRYL
ncbi:MAG: carboxypeptidase M32 [Ewingella americana]|jgi:carboxypeptidase Taq|uniref:Metal-dependent carboxypeptidase n=2 Tax=Ewingella americana TaxID=41202 RepID=A0A085GDD3_EWIA3|nr:carboxypeptidase M32 [Ewingella americana]KAA8729797.1 carboxypeptidase M32 [Ewingella americana]KFC81728.1 thermostable carboxypeptidase 1 [Ewingella americana ATCC 33852]MCI1678443.1 carboxypeptidase M32 [Ewingella americana]MCI1854030.1 carboxypeptidase M32 [Ewingella americana]MCI1861330.1 carboxypeptidase M32 [Ewingella americana]